MGETLCAVTHDPIEPSRLLDGAAGRSDGAVLLFLGVVRDHNEGKDVGHLDYEAYAGMAERVLNLVVAEARQRWAAGAIRVVHRLGRLEVGEVSVGIVVATPHRDAAYAASRYIIEELKKRAPIWKREGYVDGAAEWLGGSTPAPVEGDDR